MPACGYVFYLALVRYQVEHEKIKFVSTCGHVISSISLPDTQLQNSPTFRVLRTPFLLLYQWRTNERRLYSQGAQFSK